MEHATHHCGRTDFTSCNSNCAEICLELASQLQSNPISNIQNTKQFCIHSKYRVEYVQMMLKQVRCISALVKQICSQRIWTYCMSH